MTAYTPDKAKRLILSGKATSPMEVTGSLYLRGTQITTLPDNLTVGGWLDLSGTQITTLPDNLTVTGSLDLRGTQITTLPDNLTVTGSLYLRGHTIMNLPTAWWRENGESTRRRCIAIDPSAGHALVQTDTDKFSAGCAKNLTREQALDRWNRTDERAVLFTAAINAHVLEPVT